MNSSVEHSIEERAAAVRAIILDVDGVMTNGQIGFSQQGTIKFFNVRDGHAIKMAMREGLMIGFLSGRADAVTQARGEELGLSFIYTGQKVKMVAFEEILKDFDLKPEECLYMGDDVVDIPVMRKVGLAVTVADADEEVVPYAHLQTAANGGEGAVREAITLVMKAKGLWQKAMSRYVD